MTEVGNFGMVWTAAVVLFFVLLAGCSTGGGDAEFAGTVIEDRREAQDFRLTDQFGRSVSLGQLNEDRVVVLTFLYTYCPDICPIVAHHVKGVHERLGDDAGEVSIVVVSVDPERDTVERALEYSEAWGMAGSWGYLVGSEEELSPVWEAYYVVAAVDEEGRVAGRAGGVEGRQGAGGRCVAAGHRVAVYGDAPGPGLSDR